MLEGSLLVALFASSYMSFALLALSLRHHWRDVADHKAPRPAPCRRFRIVGYIGLALSWAIAVPHDGPSLGSLLWVAMLAVAATALALTLAWRPRWLRPVARMASRLLGGSSSDARTTSR